MAETAGDRPLYGQFGHAVYDEDAKLWSFERDVNTGTVFQTLEQVRVLVPPTSEHVQIDPSINGTIGRSRRIETQTKALIQHYPELQPASKLLPDEARVSEAVENAAAHHDPTRGNLLAFGSIHEDDGDEFLEFLAFPTGPTGSNVRVMQVQRKRRDVDDSENAWVEVPAVRGLEATWIGPGAPVESIVFARPSQHGDGFFAVRLPSQTWVFHSIIRAMKRGFPTLELNPILHLGVNDVGQRPPVDISFHPFDPWKFATIDQVGHWSIRELGGDAFNSVEEVARGDLIDQSDESSQAVNDGWARVALMSIPPVLVICNRQRLVLHDVQDDSSQQLQNVSTVLDGGSGWNLDMVVLNSKNNYLAVLTTNHILIYHVTLDAAKGLSAKCTNCIRHFRNPDDISLRMHVFPDGEDILLFLRSDLSRTIIVYRLKFSSSFHVAVSDPMELTIKSLSNENLSATRISSLHLFRLQNHLQNDTHARESPERHDLRFYSIFSLGKDLSVSEMLCSVGPHGRTAQSSLSASLETTGAGDRSVERRDKQVLERMKIRQEPVSAFVRGFRSQSRRRSTDDWTTTYEMTCERLNDIEEIEVADMNEVLSEARSQLQSDDGEGRLPIKTLRELIAGEITLPNLQNGIAELQNFQQTARINENPIPHPDMTEQAERSVLRQIDWPIGDSMPTNAASRLRSLHDSIVNNWIGPLPRQVRNLGRSTQDHLVRQIATEVTLASLVIRPKEPQENAPPQTQHTSQQVEIPIRNPATPSHSRAASSPHFDASSQRRSPAAQSTVTSSSHPSTTEATEITNLSKYTTFSKPAPPILPRSLRKVLSHWQTGADPADYDWQATSRRFAREEQAEGEELTEKERERLQRRAERYMQRQRREAEESQRLQILSSQAPELVTESQPARRRDPYRFGPSQSSQQHVASQILPGRHGGRKPPKKKQKRKSGF